MSPLESPFLQSVIANEMTKFQFSLADRRPRDGALFLIYNSSLTNNIPSRKRLFSYIASHIPTWFRSSAELPDIALTDEKVITSYNENSAFDSLSPLRFHPNSQKLLIRENWGHLFLFFHVSIYVIRSWITIYLGYIRSFRI